MTDLAPIVLFAYNRLWHLDQTLTALAKNEEAQFSDLIIFSDGPKNESENEKVQSVREYLKTIKGFKSVRIIERERNYGLGNNIIDGVTKIVNEYGKVVVLEDDLMPSPFYLKYVNDGLNKYESEKKVISIHSYIYPLRKKLPETYFIKGSDCFGWATWKDRWELFEADGSKLLKILEERNLTSEFDFDNSFPFTNMLRDQIAGRNFSWAVRWYASAFIHDKLTLFPGRSLVYHFGNDGTGTHFGSSKMLDVKLTETNVDVLDIPIEENKKVRKLIIYYLKYHSVKKYRVILSKVKRKIFGIIKIK